MVLEQYTHPGIPVEAKKPLSIAEIKDRASRLMTGEQVGQALNTIQSSAQKIAETGEQILDKQK